MSGQTTIFEEWAIVEVFGHSQYAGRVTEQTVAGCGFVRVDVPATKDFQAFTKLLGTASIFAINPCAEDVAKVAAQRIQARLAPYDDSADEL